MMRFLSSLLLPLVVGLLLLSPPSSVAQVVVYRLEFKTTGDNLNYKPYLRGYYVAPALGGTGTLLLQRAETSSERIYVTLEDFGEIFIAVDGSNKRMVFSATAANDVSTTAFLALGKLDTKIEQSGDNFELEVKVADKMEGYSLSADSMSDLPFFGLGEDSGVAGIAKLSAYLEKRRTDEANDEEEDVDTVVAGLVEFLEEEGYTSVDVSTAEEGAGEEGNQDGDGAAEGGGSTNGATATENQSAAAAAAAGAAREAAVQATANEVGTTGGAGDGGGDAVPSR